MRFIAAVVFVFALLVHAQAQKPPTLLVKDGQTVAFLGDSITGMGWGVSGGFVHLVVDGLAANGVKITPIPAGVGGNRSTEMLARVDADVITKKPDWLLLSCGVNDVWSRSIDLDTFKKQITAIVDKAQAAHIQVMILPPTPIYEASKQEFNDKIPIYADFMKQLAKERNLPCADIHQAWLDFIAAAHEPDNPNVVTIDGVHPNPDGHLVFAKTILATFGATPDQIATAQKAWNAEPAGAAMPSGFAYGLPIPLTAEELAAVNKLAADKKMNLQKLLHGIGLEAALEVLTKNDPEKVPDGGTVERQWAAIVKAKVDSMTGIAPKPSDATTPQDAHVWFGGMATTSIAQWDELKQVATARKLPVPVLAQICLMEAVRDKLASHPDLLPIWSDNITNEAHDEYQAKLNALAPRTSDTGLQLTP